MSDEEPTRKTQSSGNLKPPRPPGPPVVGMAEPEGDDEGRITISLPPKSKETVRIAIPKEPSAD